MIIKNSKSDMNMNIKSVILFVLIPFLVCCQRDVEVLHYDGSYPIMVNGTIDQEYVTRASDGGFVAGDRIGLYVVNYEGDKPGVLTLNGNQANNVQFTYDGTTRWTPDHEVYYKDKSTLVDFYGYYPYSSSIGSVEEYAFEVWEDQTTMSTDSEMSLYEASDFLWAKVSSVAPTASTVNLSFSHIMSCAVVELVEGTGFGSGEWATVRKDVLVSNVRRSSTVNLSTGEVLPLGAIPARSTVPFFANEKWRAIVVPQTVSAGVPLLTITVGNGVYSYKVGSIFQYQRGKQHVFRVAVNKKADASGYELDVSSEITPWENDAASHSFTAFEYVTVAVGERNLEAALKADGRDASLIKNLKVIGPVGFSDFQYMGNNMPALQRVNMKESTTQKYYNEIPQNAFKGKTNLVSFVFPQDIKRISRSAFEGTSIKDISSIPALCEVIGDRVFYQSLLEGPLFLPDSLKTIGNGAFFSTKITSIILPDGIREIGQDAFLSCRYLSGPLFLPESLESIGQSAFSIGATNGAGTSGFTGDLIIPNGIKEISSFTFEGAGFNGGHLILPDGLIKIGSYAFNLTGFEGELIFPNNLIRIDDYAFDACRKISHISFPSSLQSIGAAAFRNNSSLVGSIVFPESITSIPSKAFYGCNGIQEIVLGSYVTTIQADAFSNCVSVNSIKSLPSTPPLVASGAFTGVAKDNFVVEVPEPSVNQYRLSSGWKEFKRIEAHHDFSISRSLYRTLNASENKTLTLRAESTMTWRVESKPDWVTVAPNRGTGKTDVKVTVNPLSKGSGNRGGDVVFLLEGKDYRTTLKVEQYDYPYGDAQVVSFQKHTMGNGVQIVFLGDCYDAKDIAERKYLSDCQEAYSHFFSIEPYRTYKDYFDVNIVFGISPDSGVGTVNTIREARFGTQYALQRSGGSLQNDGKTAFEYARKVSSVKDISKTLIIVIINSEEYDGVTVMWSDGSAIAMCPKSIRDYPYDFRGIVQHEAGGHAFGKLGDEYIYYNAFMQNNLPVLGSFRKAKQLGWYQNLSETGDPGEVPWNHLLYHPKYSNIVDIYEGGFYHTRGVFRSETTSCMNNNIPYYSAISRQAIVERIMEYAGQPFSLEEFYSKDVLTVDTRSSQPMQNRNYSVAYGRRRDNGPIIMNEKPEL